MATSDYDKLIDDVNAEITRLSQGISQYWLSCVTKRGLQFEHVFGDPGDPYSARIRVSNARKDIWNVTILNASDSSTPATAWTAESTDELIAQIHGSIYMLEAGQIAAFAKRIYEEMTCISGTVIQHPDTARLTKLQSERDQYKKLKEADSKKVVKANGNQKSELSTAEQNDNNHANHYINPSGVKIHKNNTSLESTTTASRFHPPSTSASPSSSKSVGYSMFHDDYMAYRLSQHMPQRNPSTETQRIVREQQRNQRNRQQVRQSIALRELREEQIREDQRQLHIAKAEQILRDQGIDTDDECDSAFWTYLLVLLGNRQKFLQYSRMGLNYIPPAIGHWTAVQEVNLSSNNLTSIPIELFQSPSLRRLYIHDNKLTELPSLPAMSHLEILDFHSNQVSVIDIAHEFLAHLQVFDAAKNKLKDFPIGILSLKKIYHVDLSSNQIRYVPALQLAPSANLTLLSLRNNPILNLPPELVFKGTSTILKYLSAHSHIQSSVLESRMYTHMSNLYNDMLFSDVILESAEGDRIQCHSWILQQRCPALLRPHHSTTIHSVSSSSLINPMTGTSSTEGAEKGSAHDSPSSSTDANIIQKVDVNFNSSLHRDMHYLKFDIPFCELKHVLAFLYTDNIACIAPPTKIPSTVGKNKEEIAAITRMNAIERNQWTLTMKSLFLLADKLDLDYMKHLLLSFMASHFVATHELPKLKFSAQSTFIEDIKALWKRSETHDINFRFGSPTSPSVSAHRALLAARSLYFKAMCTSKLVEGISNEVVLEQPGHAVFQSIVEYCYTDDVNILDPETIIDLLVNSKMYRLIGLQSMLESVVGHSLDIDNACSILTLAYVHGLKNLAKSCKFFIMSFWDTVSSRKEWLGVPSELRERFCQIARNWKLT